MKTNILITTLLAFSAIVAQAQSSLTPPPGAPSPSSRTITEVYDKAATIEGQNTAQTTKIDSIATRVNKVDGRIPLVAGSPGVGFNDGYNAISIGLPGSYYLTGNIDITGTTLSNGLSIGTNNVIVDLNGYSIICQSANGNAAVNVTSAYGGNVMVHIKNGSIRGGTTVSGTTFSGSGWLNGVASGSVNTHVSDVMVFGVREDGISVSGGIVERCLVDTCGQSGIQATKVIDCTVRRSGFTAISVTGSGASRGIVQGCHAEAIKTGQVSGIYAKDGVVTNSIGISNTWFGIYAGNVSHSQGISTSGTGIDATDTADNSTGISTSDVGLQAGVATNCTAKSVSGTSALFAGTASFCRGTRANGTAINATIAIGCNSGGGTISSSQKHLGTP